MTKVYSGWAVLDGQVHQITIYELTKNKYYYALCNKEWALGKTPAEASYKVRGIII